MPNVKTQVDVRNDGRYTVTVKLIGWELNELRALGRALMRSPMGRAAGEQVLQRVAPYNPKVEVEGSLPAALAEVQGATVLGSGEEE